MENREFVFSNQYSSEGFKYWYENDETIKNKKPHTSEKFFGTDSTNEDNISFLVENKELTMIGSLGAVDMPTPFRPYKGKETKTMNFPYFVEGWHTVQSEARHIANILRNSNGTPTQAALAREIVALYRRTNTIVEGMIDVAEVMRMNMLQNGMFVLQNADAYGANLVDIYNYDGDGTWNRDHTEVLAGTAAWSDTTNSDPIADLIRYDKKMQLTGGRLTAIMASSTTMDYFFANQKVKNYTPFNIITSASYILSNGDVERILESRLGHKVSIVINDEQYRGWDGNLYPYMQPNRVVLFGTDMVGTTWNGRTYEEDSNLINGGNGYNTQTRLANGIVVSEYFKKDPDEKVFRVSRSVIPSFEGMKQVYNLLWIDSTTQWTITYDANGGTGITPKAQGVTKGQKLGYVAIPALVKTGGKRFIGWFDAATGGNAITKDYVPTANKTAYAHYEA